MKKRAECAAIVLLCAVFASVPLLVYGQKTSYGYDFRGKQYPKARINVGDNTFLYVGADNIEDLSYACHEEFAYLIGYHDPADVRQLWNPNPGLSPNVIKWMKDNKIKMCATVVKFTDAGYTGIYVNVNNGDGTFTTAIYNAYL